MRSIFFSLAICMSCFAGEPDCCIPCIMEGKIPTEDKRYASFVFALNLMQERHVRLIVETGTSRYGNENCIGDGCSTLIFGTWAARNKVKIFSVDIDKKALQKAASSLGNLNSYVQFVESDSVTFLKDFKKQIDFLYLDSFDFELDNPGPSQEHHLKEIIASEPWLTKESIVMIDDCDLPHGGKGKLVIEYLLSRGWKIVYSGYQVILVQN